MTLSVLSKVFLIVAVFIASFIAGGVYGYCDGLYHSHHSNSSGWIDLRDLDAPFGLLVYGVIFAASGTVIAAVALAMRRPVWMIFGSFVALSLVISFASVAHYQSKTDDETQVRVIDDRSQKTLSDRQLANYASLMRNVTVLQYPHSTLYSKRPGDPLIMTATDEKLSVVSYYEAVLSAPLQNSGPDIWTVTTHYHGIPLTLAVGTDEFNDGGATEIMIHTTEELPIAYSETVTIPIVPETKIQSLRGELGTLLYPGAQEDPALKTASILMFDTTDSVDKVALFYTDQLGFNLKLVMSGGKPGYTGNVNYHGILFYLAISEQSGKTYIQMD